MWYFGILILFIWSLKCGNSYIFNGKWRLLFPDIDAYPSIGFEIRDLEYNDANFILEANTFTYSAYGLASTNIYTICSGTYLLGGVGVLQTVCGVYTGLFGSCNQWGQYFSKTYNNLPSHKAIYFTATFWAFMSWDYSSDYFQIQFDSSTVISSWSMSGSLFSSSSCGVTYPNIRIYGRVPHTSSSVTVNFISRLDEASSNESWGVRDLNFLFVTSTTTQYQCATPWSIPNLPISWQCGCSTEGYYASSCASCDSSCKSCFGSGSTRCFECNSGYYWSGSACVQCHSYCSVCFGSSNSQCNICSAGKYLWGGNTCIAACDPPLVQSTTTSAAIQIPYQTQTLCDYPCNPGLLLDWNGDCQVHCDFPLRKNAISTPKGEVLSCVYPCLATEYLYWDGSCQGSCDPPFILSTYNGRNMCAFPCDTAPNTILYWDASCNNTCPFNLTFQINHGKEFCLFPCDTGYSLYNNGSCEATCDTHFIHGSFGGESFCYFPCLSNQYLYSNGSCKSSCTRYFTNLTMGQDKYCYYPCKSSQYLYNNGSCLDTCDTRFLPTVLSGEQYCNYPCLSSEYLFSNGSCLMYCSNYYTPWFDKVTNDKYCDYPCPSTEFLYNNGTCESTCALNFIPYLQGSEKFCSYPCRPSEYLYKNGSCLLSCQPHFVPFDYLGERFCDYPCTSVQYLFWNGSCLSQCLSPFVISTDGTGDRFCNRICASEEFLYQNGSCLPWCPTQFKKWNHGSDNYCNYPCSSSQYLYDNSSCLSECRADFVKLSYSGENFCRSPCEKGVYLYSNGSCLSSCSLPWDKAGDLNGKYCQHVCQDASEYMYWDKTCETSCKLPFQQLNDGVYKFCLPSCEGDEEGYYLYPNGTCKEKCLMPFLSRTEKGILFCESPCLESEYLYWNNTCLSSCSSPFRVVSIDNNNRFFECQLPCKSLLEYYYPETGECKEECDLQVVTQDEGNFLSCINSDDSWVEWFLTKSNSSALYSFRALSKVIYPIRFIDVAVPSRLQRLFSERAQNMHLLQWGWEMPDSIKDQFEKAPIPTIFSKYNQNLHSEFIVNYWKNLSSFALIGFLILLFRGIEIIFKKKEMMDWHLLFGRLGTFVRWNLCILLVTMTLDDVILFSTLEIKSFIPDSAESVVSFISCLFVMIGSATLLIGCFFITLNIYDAKKLSKVNGSYQSYCEMLERWQGFQVVFRGFNDDKCHQSMFYFIYAGRFGLNMLIAATVYELPLLQASLYLSINLSMFCYIVREKPIKRNVNLVQLIMIEILTLIVYGNLFNLALLNEFELENETAFILAGDLIIICNFGVNLLIAFFFGLKLSLLVISALTFRKQRYRHYNIIWFQALFFPFQQTAFGFEQMQVAPFISEITDYQPTNDNEALSTFQSLEKKYLPKESRIMNTSENYFPTTMNTEMEELNLPNKLASSNWQTGKLNPEKEKASVEFSRIKNKRQKHNEFALDSSQDNIFEKDKPVEKETEKPTLWNIHSGSPTKVVPNFRYDASKNFKGDLLFDLKHRTPKDTSHK